PDHAARILAELKRRGHTNLQSHHHRGLAGIDPTLLASSCLAPPTRKADVMTVADAEDAIRVFSVLPEL
ncbi:MAG TPA: DNA gyrase subunit B, partial [Casimicrobium sp.]|nr:DNA gyrase subunit B [Casimicrobium sp.]